jgi:predicted GNAT superfamily acetyltransferase
VYRDDDLDALVALNDGAYPAVPITPRDEFAALVALGDLVLVVDDGGPAGFVIALAPGRDYASENYRWFSARSTDFFYIDRIVVAPHLHGQGVGRRVYEAVFEAARSRGASEVTAEVNLQPPNPGSLAFHARMGFARVGEQPTKGGDVVVALLAAPVPPA